ncbi:MAG: hypothetical protein K2H09_04760 [Treponemataceae bacterium]|nr:hypothetical protein [Treponemataceae bacterium]
MEEPCKNKDEVKKEGGGWGARMLPPWRVNQIAYIASKELIDGNCASEEFDYKLMLAGKGIKLMSFSSFSPDRLAELRKVSCGLWEEGMCLIWTDDATGTQCRMIVYNDGRSPEEVQQIIFHEYGHIVLRHTQQSQHGEIEAYIFGAVAALCIAIFKGLAAMGIECRTDRMVQAIKRQLLPEEVHDEDA